MDQTDIEHDMDHLELDAHPSFLPAASLSLEAAVTPALVPANSKNPLLDSLTVLNTRGSSARGLVVGGTALSVYERSRHDGRLVRSAVP